MRNRRICRYTIKWNIVKVNIVGWSRKVETLGCSRYAYAACGSDRNTLRNQEVTGGERRRMCIIGAKIISMEEREKTKLVS